VRSFSTNPQESFMSGSNSVYVEEMYRAWLKNKER
jgi:2-oxoglutarate dehydrogenase complex dehydrogenase (E1) component-like enzyme